MSVILHVDAWKLGIAFFVLMLLAGWVGVVVAPKVGQATDNGRTRIADASIALFALLLAFSFSGAADRYENRKGFLLDEAGHFEEPLDFGVMRRPAAAGGPDDVSARV